MSKIIRFEIVIDTSWQVSINSEGAGPGWPLIRPLRSTADDNDFKFPLPPEDDMPEAKDAWRSLCEGDVEVLREIYERITDRRPETDGTGDIELFGRYLFQTLIGSEWPKILDHAENQNADKIDLALSWSNADRDLHRLNWEMMHGPDNFLAAMQPSTVAITRLVNGTDHTPADIKLPPRVLFVVGTSLADPEIQAGYEIYNLLHKLKLGGRSINSRLLERAKPTELEAVIEEFKPHVVHFICHGYIDNDGNGYLELELDEKENNKQRYAEQLLQYLTAQGKVQFPPIVVLSACWTGRLLGPCQTGPLAAELVAGGIPLVIGMAGEVSDLACRLFARRFGDALVKGVPLVLATAQGRRFAFAHGHPPHRSVDWAFPTLFASAGVEADYAPKPVEGDAPQSQIDQWISAYDLERDNEPVFCDRNECFDAYYKLFRTRPVLIIKGQKKMGKSRLIRELTAQAIRDGHLPIVISEDDPLKEMPKTMEQLRVALMSAIARASKAYGIVPVFDQLEKLAEPVDFTNLNPELKNPVRTELMIHKKITSMAMLLALAFDLNEQVKQAQKKFPSVMPAKSRPIVLLDELHLYDRNFLAGLDQAVGKFGIGPSEAESVPLVIAFQPTPAADKIFKSHMESQKTWLTVLDLEPFPQEKDEDLMVYRRVLLNPFNKELFPDVSDKAFAVNHEAKKEDLVQWFGWVRTCLCGIPGRLIEPQLYVLADIGSNAAKGQVLIKSDDQVLLEQMRENE